MISDILRVLQKLLKYFKRSAFTIFLLPAEWVHPVILSLNLNDSESVILLNLLFYCRRGFSGYYNHELKSSKFVIWSFYSFSSIDKIFQMFSINCHYILLSNTSASQLYLIFCTVYLHNNYFAHTVSDCYATFKYFWFTSFFC